MAYYTSDAGPEDDAAETFRTQVSATLPAYMVPAAYVRLESFPLTPNGKLDRKALPAPGADAYAVREYEAPIGEVETAVAEIWADVLKVERVGRRDHFFDLGGHSLLAVQVMVRLRDALGVEVALKDLFARPVLADLAQGLERAARAHLPPIALARSATAGCRCRSRSSGCGSWRRWRASARRITCSFGVRLRGALDRAALRRALDRIVERHEVLRTRFVGVDGEPAQQIVPAEQSRFELRGARSARRRPTRPQRLQRLVAEEAARRSIWRRAR